MQHAALPRHVRPRWSEPMRQGRCRRNARERAFFAARSMLFSCVTQARLSSRSVSQLSARAAGRPAPARSAQALRVPSPACRWTARCARHFTGCRPCSWHARVPRRCRRVRRALVPRAQLLRAPPSCRTPAAARRTAAASSATPIANRHGLQHQAQRRRRSGPSPGAQRLLRGGRAAPFRHSRR